MRPPKGWKTWISWRQTNYWEGKERPKLRKEGRKGWGDGGRRNSGLLWDLRTFGGRQRNWWIGGLRRGIKCRRLIECELEFLWWAEDTLGGLEIDCRREIDAELGWLFLWCRMWRVRSIGIWRREFLLGFWRREMRRKRWRAWWLSLEEKHMSIIEMRGRGYSQEEAILI